MRAIWTDRSLLSFVFFFHLRQIMLSEFTHPRLSQPNFFSLRNYPSWAGFLVGYMLVDVKFGNLSFKILESDIHGTP